MAAQSGNGVESVTRCWRAGALKVFLRFRVGLENGYLRRSENGGCWRWLGGVRKRSEMKEGPRDRDEECDDIE